VNKSTGPVKFLAVYVKRIAGHGLLFTGPANFFAGPGIRITYPAKIMTGPANKITYPAKILAGYVILLAGCKPVVINKCQKNNLDMS
jgi:hypothetical protein